MSSLTCFKPPIYHNFENIETNEFDFLSLNEIQINFCKCDLALTNCHACDNCTPKRPVIEKMCDNYTLNSTYL